LLYSTLDRRLRPGRLPTEKGVLLLDGAAALALGQRSLDRRAMLEVPLAIRDRNAGQSHYIMAPVGASLEQILRFIDVRADGLILRGGDLLAQIPLRPDAVISGAELKLTLLPRLNIVSGPCLRCGWCLDRCPTAARPAELLEAAQQEEKVAALDAG